MKNETRLRKNNCDLEMRDGKVSWKIQVLSCTNNTCQGPGATEGGNANIQSTGLKEAWSDPPPYPPNLAALVCMRGWCPSYKMHCPAAFSPRAYRSGDQTPQHPLARNPFLKYAPFLQAAASREIIPQQLCPANKHSERPGLQTARKERVERRETNLEVGLETRALASILASGAVGASGRGCVTFHQPQPCVPGITAPCIPAVL